MFLIAITKYLIGISLREENLFWFMDWETIVHRDGESKGWAALRWWEHELFVLISMDPEAQRQNNDGTQLASSLIHACCVWDPTAQNGANSPS